MVPLATTIFLTSLSLLVAAAVLVQLEERRGKRFFLAQLRQSLDHVLAEVKQASSNAWSHFTRYVVQLGWYYSLHSLLKTSLNLLVRLYEYIEQHFENNRKKAKLLRAEMRQKIATSPLSKVAEHKAQVALTLEEQERLRAEKLEDTH